MRVTNESFLRQFLDGLAANRATSERALRGLSDGKRVRVASDDPAAARSALALRARLARLEGYERTGSDARFRLATIEGSLGQVVGLLSEARELALQAGSDVYEQQAENLALDVDGLRRDILEIANQQRDGRYVFAGTATDTRPFDDAGVYAGTANEAQVPIDDARTVGTTVDGARAFQGGGDVFATLDALATAIRAGDGDAIEAAAAALSAEIAHVNVSRAEIGLRLETIELARTRHGDERVAVGGRIAELEDVRIEELVVELTGAETGYEALSSAAATVLNRSLFDYLR